MRGVKAWNAGEKQPYRFFIKLAQLLRKPGLMLVLSQIRMERNTGEIRGRYGENYRLLYFFDFAFFNEMKASGFIAKTLSKLRIAAPVVFGLFFWKRRNSVCSV